MMDGDVWGTYNNTLYFIRCGNFQKHYYILWFDAKLASITSWGLLIPSKFSGWPRMS